jgi:DNA (cytosine-5)-methyltransferase 1
LSAPAASLPGGLTVGASSTSAPRTSTASPRPTSSRASGSGRTRSASQAGQMMFQFGLAPAPASPSVPPGRGGGFTDERHLWPVWFELIRQRRPPVVFGEQVASPDGLKWLDSVFADLEGEGYSVGAADLCAAGVGAPHRRQRLFFCAYADRSRGRFGPGTWRVDAGISEPPHGGLALDSDDAFRSRLEGHRRDVYDSRGPGWLDPEQARSASEAGATRGFWRDCDWYGGRDGKFRPIGPGLFPLAHGAPGRVGKLRAYGNAISPQVAATFIRAALGWC